MNITIASRAKYKYLLFNFFRAKQLDIFQEDSSMARRNGVPSLQKTAQLLCRLITVFSPLIQRQFPDNTPLLTALAAAHAACEALDAQLVPIRDVGS